MGKTEQVAKKLSKEESLGQVRALVGQASALLKQMSPEHARLAWLLEDTLAYLDEIDGFSSLADLDLPEECSSSEDLRKTANVTTS